MAEIKIFHPLPTLSLHVSQCCSPEELVRMAGIPACLDRMLKITSHSPFPPTGNGFLNQFRSGFFKPWGQSENQPVFPPVLSISSCIMNKGCRLMQNCTDLSFLNSVSKELKTRPLMSSQVSDSSWEPTVVISASPVRMLNAISP